MIQMLGEYEEIKFKSINQGDLDLDSEEDKENIKIPPTISTMPINLPVIVDGTTSP